jgi:hypothetical protein
MCHFITATLPQTANHKSVSAIFTSYQLAFKQIANPHVLSQLDAKDIYILTTTGRCDCGTVLGRLNGSSESQSINYPNDVKKFRKQGWSEAKIQRWLSEKEQVQEKQESKNIILTEESTLEASHWVEFIKVLLKSGFTQRLGLLLHLYHSGIESERIKILRKERICLAELSPEFIMRIEEDILYEFFV